MLPLWTLIPGWLLTVVIVTGNGLVIYLITTRPRLQTTTNWFVLSLAVADFGVGTVYYPRLSFCSIHDNKCVNTAVIIAFSIGVLFLYASVTNLCALTLDRYLAIVKPLRYVTFMTRKCVALLIFAAWSVAFLALVSFVVLLLRTSGTTNKIMAKWITLCLTILCIFACIFLLFATVRIFLIARKHSRQTAAIIAQLNYNHKIQHRPFGNQDVAATKLVGTVVAVFVLSYMLDIYDNICGFGGHCPVNGDTMGAFSTLTLLLNSAINPVAYAFFKREIRRELNKLFRWKPQQSPAAGPFNIDMKQRNLRLTLRRSNRVDQRPDFLSSENHSFRKHRGDPDDPDDYMETRL